MQSVRFFALACAAVVVFDAVASFASLAIGFNYAHSVFGSAVLYVVFAYFCAKRFGFWRAVLLGAAMGLTDATLGWAISWAVGPGRPTEGTLAPSVFVLTAIAVVVLGALLGLIGGGIGAFANRRSAA